MVLPHGYDDRAHREHPPLLATCWPWPFSTGDNPKGVAARPRYLNGRAQGCPSHLPLPHSKQALGVTTTHPAGDGCTREIYQYIMYMIRKWKAHVEQAQYNDEKGTLLTPHIPTTMS